MPESATPHTWTLTMLDFVLMREQSWGGCIACGALTSGVEPDARRYRCVCCRAMAVFGSEELLLMGRITVKEAADETHQG